MIEIKHRYTNAVICSFDVETVKEAVVKAIASRANLSRADLSGADLSGADLSGAYLSGADLSGADLSGEKLAIAPISILNLNWNVLITESYLTIGCKRYMHTEWKEFDMDTIAKMSEGAAKFWAQWRSPLLAMCKAHRAESLKARKEQS